jgi:hypothetical protein
MRPVRRTDKHVPIVLQSGSLNLLEPSGPVQACLTFTLHYQYKIHLSANYTVSRAQYKLRIQSVSVISTSSWAF